jgi:hypothetical protein
MDYPGWLWIPITVWAAFAQTLRNATQRGSRPGSARWARRWCAFSTGCRSRCCGSGSSSSSPASRRRGPDPAFAAWVALGALSQIAATALLLRTMQERNFALGVAYSKTEVVQSRCSPSSRWATG